ncbi:developmentally-regulated protein [Acrasis kona]|uniref:Developmentally-regulated protein n=1 Tax=Acrasis kona TaxID=1008807 RepID=A0AAW2ZRM4_9EUKA
MDRLNIQRITVNNASGEPLPQVFIDKNTNTMYKRIGEFYPLLSQKDLFGSIMSFLRFDEKLRLKFILVSKEFFAVYTRPYIFHWHTSVKHLLKMYSLLLLGNTAETNRIHTFLVPPPCTRKLTLCIDTSDPVPDCMIWMSLLTNLQEMYIDEKEYNLSCITSISFKKLSLKKLRMRLISTMYNFGMLRNYISEELAVGPDPKLPGFDPVLDQYADSFSDGEACFSKLRIKKLDVRWSFLFSDFTRMEGSEIEEIDMSVNDTSVIVDSNFAKGLSKIRGIKRINIYLVKCDSQDDEDNDGSDEEEHYADAEFNEDDQCFCTLHSLNRVSHLIGVDVVLHCNLHKVSVVNLDLKSNT